MPSPAYLHYQIPKKYSTFLCIHCRCRMNACTKWYEELKIGKKWKFWKHKNEEEQRGMQIPLIDIFEENYFYAIKILIQFINEHLGQALNP